MSVATAPRAAAPAMSQARAAVQPTGPGGPSAVDPKSFNAASAAARAAAPVSAPVSAAPATSIRPEARPAERRGFLGGFTSLADMFDGGGPGRSGTSFEGRFAGIGNALGLKPSAGRAGDGAAQAPRSMDRDGPDRSGIASLAPAEPAPPANPEVPAMTAAELAMLGAPTTPMAPVFVDSPVYAAPNIPTGAINPALSYGAAFGQPTQNMGMSAMNPYQNVSQLDIFSQYPYLGQR